MQKVSSERTLQRWRMNIFGLKSRLLSMVPALLIVGGCALGYQSAYDNDLRFEHCYRLDEESRVPLGDKRACWLEWSLKNTYGQSHDRITYALAREQAIGQAQAIGQTTAPPGMTAALNRPRIACPQPTNAFAPPPHTLASDVAAKEAKGDAGTPALPALGPPVDTLALAPGASCGGSCGRAWVQCGAQCRGPAGQCRCDEQYRSCMRSCF